MARHIFAELRREETDYTPAPGAPGTLAGPIITPALATAPPPPSANVVEIARDVVRMAAEWSRDNPSRGEYLRFNTWDLRDRIAAALRAPGGSAPDEWGRLRRLAEAACAYTDLQRESSAWPSPERERVLEIEASPAYSDKYIFAAVDAFRAPGGSATARSAVPPQGVPTRTQVADLLAAAQRWRRCHGAGRENVWNQDLNTPESPPECLAGTCDVLHARLAHGTFRPTNEYYISEDHLAALVDRLTLEEPPR